MAVLVRMTERCSMASSLSCAPARRGAICRNATAPTRGLQPLQSLGQERHLAAHVRDLGSQVATGLDNAIGRSPGGLSTKIRQGCRYTICSEVRSWLYPAAICRDISVTMKIGVMPITSPLRIPLLPKIVWDLMRETQNYD